MSSTANNHEESGQVVLKRSLNGTGCSVASAGILIVLVAFYSFTQVSFLFGCLILSLLLLLPVAYLCVLRNDEPKVIMDEKGIYAKDVGQFTWENIQEIWPEYYRGVCMLVLKLNGNGHVRFAISSLTMQPDDIRYYIENQIAKHAEKNK